MNPKRSKWKVAAWLVLVAAGAWICFVEVSEETPENEILLAMESNLAAVGNLTADLSCTCSEPAYSFARGYLRRKPADKIGIWRGASNSQVWSNATCFNFADPTDNLVYGYRWNDTSENQWLSWALHVGYFDNRTALESMSRATNLELAECTEVVNAVTCRKLAAIGQRWWVDSGNAARMMRWECDHQDGSLFYRADYTDWTRVGNGQVPTRLDVEVFHGENVSWRRFEFSLSNVQIGASIDDAFFVIWTPPDTKDDR